MVAVPRLTKTQREELSDARLLLESAAHNAGIAARATEELDAERIQALRNAATLAAQGAAALKRVVKEL